MASADMAAPKPAPPSEGPETVWEQAAGAAGKAKLSTEANIDREQPAETTEEPIEKAAPSNRSADSSDGGSQPSDTIPNAKRRPTVSNRPPVYRPPNRVVSTRPPVQSRSARARYIGMTADGYLIMRLPSGQTILVRPNDQLQHHRARRVYTGREQAPWAPPYEPFIAPNG
jgi:hypothetical protein